MTTKALALTGLLGLAAVAGCTSYVKTYDGNGNLLGACKHGGDPVRDPDGCGHRRVLFGVRQPEGPEVGSAKS